MSYFVIWFFTRSQSVDTVIKLFCIFCSLSVSSIVCVYVCDVFTYCIYLLFIIVGLGAGGSLRTGMWCAISFTLIWYLHYAYLSKNAYICEVQFHAYTINMYFQLSKYFTFLMRKSRHLFLLRFRFHHCSYMRVRLSLLRTHRVAGFFPYATASVSAVFHCFLLEIFIRLLLLFLFSFSLFCCDRLFIRRGEGEREGENL